jgi:hypothetical protein
VVCKRRDCLGRGAALGDWAAVLYDLGGPGGLVYESAALFYGPRESKFDGEPRGCGHSCGGCSGCVECSEREPVLSQGGALDEHVSGANAFLGANGPTFPADVQSSNYLAKQIAVIYDSDGSVTDLLLGNGASDPSGCLQNGVTESVDSIVPAGFIQHAILILNGRCTGPAPQQQMQLQYQLMRAFGRVLGLGWSQTNDNVFTDSPQPTGNQALN